MAPAVLSTANSGEKTDLCLICCQSIEQNEKAQQIGEKGLERFQALVKQWSTINIPLQDARHRYTEAYSKITSSTENENVLRVHTTCRVQFRTNIERCTNKFGLKITDEEGAIETDYEFPERRATRSVTKPLYSKKVCFVCNTERVIDKNPYNEGGLARCYTKIVADRLATRKELFMKDKDCRPFSVALRLEILLSGQAHDIFAIDIYYHQSCYIKFVLSPSTPKEIKTEENQKENDVFAVFLYRVKTRIIRDKQAFLLNELLIDIQILSEEEGLNGPAITNTRTLKWYIIEHTGEQISFFHLDNI